MPYEQHIREELDELIQVCRHGAEAYREGAEHTRKLELQRVLYEISAERGKFAADLERAAASWGRANLERKDTLYGTLQRGWTELKANLGGGDDAILSALEAGDDCVRKRYDEAIRYEKTPAEIVGILRNQAQAIVGTLDRIRTLRRKREAA